MGRAPKSNLPIDLSSTLKAIGANITALRTELGITQAELSRRSHVSITTLNEIETRRFRDIRVSTLCAFARALNVPVSRLLGASDVDVRSRDHLQLLKASETIHRIARKIKVK